MSHFYRIASYSFVTGDLAKRVADHNTRCEVWAADEAKLIDLQDGALGDPIACVPGVLTTIRDNLLTGFHSLFHRKVELASDAKALIGEVCEAGEMAGNEASLKSNSVLEAATRKLKEVFHTLPISHAEAKARQTDECRAARGQVIEIKDQVRALGDQRREITSDIVATREKAKNLVRQTIKIQLA